MEFRGELGVFWASGKCTRKKGVLGACCVCFVGNSGRFLVLFSSPPSLCESGLQWSKDGVLLVLATRLGGMEVMGDGGCQEDGQEVIGVMDGLKLEGRSQGKGGCR